RLQPSAEKCGEKLVLVVVKAAFAFEGIEEVAVPDVLRLTSCCRGLHKVRCGAIECDDLNTVVHWVDPHVPIVWSRAGMSCCVEVAIVDEDFELKLKRR